MFMKLQGLPPLPLENQANQKHPEAFELLVFGEQFLRRVCVDPRAAWPSSRAFACSLHDTSRASRSQKVKYHLNAKVLDDMQFSHSRPDPRASMDLFELSPSCVRLASCRRISDVWAHPDGAVNVLDAVQSLALVDVDEMFTR